MTFQRILFAVDGGHNMRSAAASVASLALATGVEVTVLHVTENPLPGMATLAIERIAQRLRATGIATRVEVRFAGADDVAETIVGVSRELDSALIALGSHGLSDLSGLFRGSISHRVIALSDVPVLVVRYGIRRGGHIRRILLAIAGGEEVPHAIEAAVTIAKATDAEVLVLHAKYLVAGIESLPYIESDDYAEQMVVTVVRQAWKAGIHAVAYRPVASNGVPRGIVHEARTWNADLVVVGSRRLSDLASLLLGGIDHELIRTSDRSVLVAERPDALVASATSG